MDQIGGRNLVMIHQPKTSDAVRKLPWTNLVGETEDAVRILSWTIVVGAFGDETPT